MGEKTKESKVNVLFPNLLAELARVNMSKTGLAKAVGISITSIYYKFNGNIDWTLDDMDAIKSVLEGKGGQELSLDYLFKRCL